MQIVAQRSEDTFLVMTGPNRARVLEVSTGTFFPEFNMQSILARGYWEEYTGAQDVLPSLLKQVKAYDTWDESIAAENAKRQGTIAPS